ARMVREPEIQPSTGTVSGAPRAGGSGLTRSRREDNRLRHSGQPRRDAPRSARNGSPSTASPSCATESGRRDVADEIEFHRWILFDLFGLTSYCPSQGSAQRG